MANSNAPLQVIEGLRPEHSRAVLELSDSMTLFRLKSVSRDMRDECTTIIEDRITDRNPNGTYKPSCIFHRENPAAGETIQKTLPQEYTTYAINISFSVPNTRFGRKNGKHMRLLTISCGDSSVIMEVNAWNAQLGALRFDNNGFDMYSDLPMTHAAGRGVNDGREHELVVLVEYDKVLMFVDGVFVSHTSQRHETRLPRPMFRLAEGQATAPIDIRFGATTDANNRNFEGEIHSVSLRRAW